MSEVYKQVQLELFDLSDTVVDVVELFPEVWKALELVISPIVENRYIGLERIIKLNAHRLSPIVTHILATCLDDEDIDFRYKIVQAVGELLSRDEIGMSTPHEVKKQLKYYLSKMRQRKIYALLQVVEYQPSSLENVALLLKACSYAGKILGDIFSDNKLPIDIRQKAIQMAGYVGFLETVPRLEKLASKLESRMKGQRTMSFAPSTNLEENNLIPMIQSALVLLKSP